MRGITTTDIVDELNVSRSTVSRWLSGISEPRGENRTALMRLLNTDYNFRNAYIEKPSDPDSVHSIVFETDTEGNIIHAYPRISKITRFSFVGKNIIDYSLQPDRLRAIYEVVKLGGYVETECCFNVNDKIVVSFLRFTLLQGGRVKINESWVDVMDSDTYQAYVKEL